MQGDADGAAEIVGEVGIEIGEERLNAVGGVAGAGNEQFDPVRLGGDYFDWGDF